MTKKILLCLGTIFAVVAGVAAMSAYEAHVINVTAHIENALKIIAPSKLTFGTVFPQEYRKQSIWITTSDSFCAPDQWRVTNIDYKIVQKPKPYWPIPAECDYYGVDPEATIEDVRAYCHRSPGDLTCCYPSLCPYLSKDPIDGDLDPYDDHGVLAFHDPDSPSSVAFGTIHKKEDQQDQWIIDLAVPCFEGMCSQDWDEFVYQYNQTADPDDYILSAELESKDFGCDLWVEVTKIY